MGTLQPASGPRMYRGPCVRRRRYLHSPIKPQSAVESCSDSGLEASTGRAVRSECCEIRALRDQSAGSVGLGLFPPISTLTRDRQRRLPRASTTVRSKALRYCPSLAWPCALGACLDGAPSARACIHHRICADLDLCKCQSHSRRRRLDSAREKTRLAKTSAPTPPSWQMPHPQSPHDPPNDPLSAPNIRSSPQFAAVAAKLAAAPPPLRPAPLVLQSRNITHTHHVQK